MESTHPSVGEPRASCWIVEEVWWLKEGTPRDSEQSPSISVFQPQVCSCMTKFWDPASRYPRIKPLHLPSMRFHCAHPQPCHHPKQQDHSCCLYHLHCRHSIVPKWGVGGGGQQFSPQHASSPVWAAPQPPLTLALGLCSVYLN